jgi:Spy/CpxP family protein refolding chaperone
MFSRRLAAAVLGAALSVPAAALAQQTPFPSATAPAYPAAGPRAGHHHHNNRFRAALRGLNLSAAQQQQIDQAFARTKTANRNADRATRRANMQKLRSDVETILTPAQRAQLQTQLRKSRGQRRGGAFATPMPGPTPVH